MESHDAEFREGLSAAREKRIKAGHLIELVCGDPGAVLVSHPSGKVFVAADKATAITNGCEILATRDQAVRGFSLHNYDAGKMAMLWQASRTTV